MINPLVFFITLHPSIITWFANVGVPIGAPSAIEQLHEIPKRFSNSIISLLTSSPQSLPNLMVSNNVIAVTNIFESSSTLPHPSSLTSFPISFNLANTVHRFTKHFMFFSQSSLYGTFAKLLSPKLYSAQTSPFT